MTEFTSIGHFVKGMTVTGFYLVKSMNIKTSASNKQYGDYVLADQTGEISAKIWNIDNPQGLPETGAFLKVQGLVTDWQGKLQLRMDRYREVVDSDPVDISTIVPSAPESPRSMLEELDEYVQRIENADLRKLVETAVAQKRSLLEYWPGALKNHHSIRSGLVYHTLSILRLADGVLDVYDFLQPDWLYAGIIMHDMAKTEEMEAETSGAASQFTLEGRLLGHISQGVLLVDRLGRELGTPKDMLTILEHMILSHHELPEYGSPRRPMFAEAEILHYLDTIDARMYDFNLATKDLKPGQFSDAIWTLENRRVFYADLPHED